MPPKRYTTSRRTRIKPNIPMPEKGEHWSVTIGRREVGAKYGRKWIKEDIAVDFDTRLDNWDTEDPESDEDVR